MSGPAPIRIRFSILDRNIVKEVTPHEVSVMLLNASQRTHGDTEQATALAMEAQAEFFKGSEVSFGVFSFKKIA